MARKHLVVLIHGIRTGRTSPSWPKHFAGWAAPLDHVATDAIYYEAGPFSIWNNLVVNPRLSRELARAAGTFVRIPAPDAHDEVTPKRAQCATAFRVWRRENE